MNPIVFAKVHPAIGIARVGNHPSASFIGPELPYDETIPAGGYKADDAGTLKVKRQAARFRVFGYDAQGQLVRELDNDTAQIVWTLTLANRKAAWERYAGPRRESKLRNSTVPLSRRDELVIGPLQASLPNAKPGAVRLGGGQFLSWESTNKHTTVDDVLLGELHVDEHGRALVLAGHGRSASPIGLPLVNYANNDSWFDDIADGPLDATVQLREGSSMRTIPVEGAWVITAPPNFAPHVQAIVTLHDMLRDRAIRAGLLEFPREPSFAYDIYPILDATLRTRAVYAFTGNDYHYHFFKTLREADAPLAARRALLARMRVPASLRNEFPGSASGNMPMLRDATDDWQPDGRMDIGFTVTPTQYRMLVLWAEGKVATDGEHGKPPRVTTITPKRLDRAALMSCVGGPFYPGIEAGWFLQDPRAIDMNERDYLRICRGQILFGERLVAGDLTKHMAVPWQADFLKCTKYGSDTPGWWPSVRPNEVVVPPEKQRKSWTRDHVATHDDMVSKWWKLGFVVGEGDELIECQRNPA
jgi:hypothetical protein